MNRTRMMIVAFFALVLSALVSVMAYRQVRARLNPGDDRSQIVVAAERLPLGTRLDEDNLRLAPWSSSVALEGSFSDPLVLIGRGVIVPMIPNEPVLDSKLAPTEAGAGLTSAIPEGMRAVAVKVNDVIGVAGFVLPGTRVDVILTGEDNKVEVSKIILENIQVLAADQNLEQDASGKPREVQVITLLVTPEESQKVALASVEGRIQLALRNPLDFANTYPNAVRKPALYGRTPEAPTPKVTVRKMMMNRKSPEPKKIETKPEAPQSQSWDVETIQGTNRETHSFEVR